MKGSKKWLFLTSLCLSFLVSAFILSAPTNAVAKQTQVTLTGQNAQWFFTDSGGGTPGGWTNAGVGWRRTINNEMVYYQNLQLRWLIDAMPGATDAPSGHDMQVIVWFKHDGLTTPAGQWPRLLWVDNDNLNACAGTPCTISNYTPATDSVTIYFDLDMGSLPSTGWINPYSQYSTDAFMILSNNQNNNAPYTIGVDRIQITYWTTDDTATLQNGLEQVNNSVNEVNDFLRDDSAPSANTDNLSNAAGWLPAGPVDSILNIPLIFIGGIIDSLMGGNNCRPMDLPLPYVNKNIQLPCMRPIMEQMGFLTIWNIVGAMISWWFIYDTLKWLYKYVDDTLSLRENKEGIWGGL